jgi:hypothetical protein
MLESSLVDKRPVLVHIVEFLCWYLNMTSLQNNYTSLHSDDYSPLSLFVRKADL